MGFLTWLQETEFVQFLGYDPYAYPIMLCFHAVGMAVVVGIVWMMSLRVLGYPRGLSLDAFARLSTIAFYGFMVNFISGLMIFSTEATRIIDNREFLIKMGSIVVGLITVWYMSRSLRLLRAAGQETFPVPVKVIAVISSLAWLIAILAGRYIAYTIKPPFAV